MLQFQALGEHIVLIFYIRTPLSCSGESTQPDAGSQILISLVVCRAISPQHL